MSKPILCIDFDGVLHSYESGWQGADVVADGPVPGAIAFLFDAVQNFSVVVYSSRSTLEAGRDAMANAIHAWLLQELSLNDARAVFYALDFAHKKPAAFLTIDDRAVCFDGTFPPVADLLAFKPWNKR